MAAAQKITSLPTGAPTLAKGWAFYGCGPTPAYVTSEATARPVWMTRKGQKVRFVDATGEQVGPEQANVAPACCFAASEGWIDPTNPTLSIMCTLEVRGQLGR